MEEDDDEDIQLLMMAQNMDTENTKKEKPVYGKGNAKIGFKAKHKLYDPSDVFERVQQFSGVVHKHMYTHECMYIVMQISVRQQVWDEYIKLLSIPQFLQLCNKCYSRWELPRNGG